MKSSQRPNAVRGWDPDAGYSMQGVVYYGNGYAYAGPKWGRGRQIVRKHPKVRGKAKVKATKKLRRRRLQQMWAGH